MSDLADGQRRPALAIRWGLVVGLAVPYLLLSVGLAPTMRVFGLEAFESDGPSMEPTLAPGDLFIVDKARYGAFLPLADEAFRSWEEPRIGDVVVVHSPYDDIDIVKRVVATSGDLIEMREDVVYVNGESLHAGNVRSCETEDPECERVDERFADRTWTTSRSRLSIPDGFEPVRVPAAHVFVLGDHRDRSNDSRNPRVGMIPLARLKGRALAVYSSARLGGIGWERAGLGDF